jgi:hypothetical protein
MTQKIIRLKDRSVPEFNINAICPGDMFQVKGEHGETGPVYVKTLPNGPFNAVNIIDGRLWHFTISQSIFPLADVEILIKYR